MAPPLKLPATMDRSSTWVSSKRTCKHTNEEYEDLEDEVTELYYVSKQRQMAVGLLPKLPKRWLDCATTSASPVSSRSSPTTASLMLLFSRKERSEDWVLAQAIDKPFVLVLAKIRRSSHHVSLSVF
ncbi:hypothetical protein M758_1G316200 [Ceratodon purpureus]|nr:hypothetical protein M758_1G316200 [Ceratodon purpureus]